ncbi:MAG: hypothetical protein WA101_03055 [Minisyncoccia bacterium]
MKNLILCVGNRDETIQLIRKVSLDKKYWLGCCDGLINDVKQNNHQWFSGKGTFERIIYLFPEKAKMMSAIDIRHEDAINGLSVIPESTEINFGSTIIFSEDDDILIYSPRTKMTQIFMAWTVSRNEFFLNRMGKTSDASQFFKEDSY